MDRLINKDQLLRFAQSVYSAGCHGYMDLLENFCERAVDDLYKDLKHPSMPMPLVAVSGAASPPPMPMISVDSSLYTYPQYLDTNEMLRNVTLTNITETPEG